MSYFRELPNFQYQSPFIDSLSSSEYVTVKNIFRRMTLRDDLKNIFTVFNKYEIKEGDRPDTVAEEVYGVLSNECMKITEPIEKKLGTSVYIEPKPEYYQQKNVTLQHDQNTNQEQT